MSLSCYCPDDGEWWYIPHDDYAPLKTIRSRKCWSCGERIGVGALSLRCDCYRQANGKVEERIHGYGGEVFTKATYLCEPCADLYFSLDELGFCINHGENMRELVKEYAEVYGPQRRKAA